MKKFEKRSPEGAISEGCLVDYHASVEAITAQDGVSRDWAHVRFPNAFAATEWAHNTGMSAQCRFRNNPPVLSVPVVLLVSLH